MPDEIKKEETVVVKEDDLDAEFDKAFAEAVGDKGRGESEDLEAALPSVEDSGGTGEEVTTQDPVEQEPAPVVTQTPQQEQDFKALFEQAQADLLKERQRAASWDGRIRAANERAVAAEARAAALESGRLSREAEAETEISDPEEDKALKEFITEFPDIQVGIKALAKRMAKSIVKSELAAIRPEIESIRQTTQVSAKEAHFRAIEKAHSDFRQLRDAGTIKDWIDSKPSILQSTYLNIYNTGSAKEIVEMLDICKKEINLSNKGEVKRIPSVVEAAKKFTAVPSHSSGPRVTQQASKDDFDAAWDEAVKQG